jgi:hypothetical protein
LCRWPLVLLDGARCREDDALHLCRYVEPFDHWASSAYRLAGQLCHAHQVLLGGANLLYYMWSAAVLAERSYVTAAKRPQPVSCEFKRLLYGALDRRPLRVKRKAANRHQLPPCCLTVGDCPRIVLLPDTHAQNARSRG